MARGKRLFVADVAREAKLNPNVVRKLADMGKIKHMQRDFNGWRIFSPEAIKEVKKLAGTM